MKKTEKMRLSYLFAACVIALGCSAEVTNDGLAPLPPPTASPKDQSLLVTGPEKSEAEYNEIFINNPPEDITFYFGYKATKEMSMNWARGSRSGINCDTGKAMMKAKWLEVKGGSVVASHNWDVLNESFLTEADKEYKLSISLSELKSCDYISLSFVIESSDVKTVKLAEEDLMLGRTNYVYPDRREARMYHDFHFNSDIDANLYFTSVVPEIDIYCKNKAKIEMEWLTLDKLGNTSNTLAVSEFSNFVAKKNSNQVLRVWFKNTENCMNLKLRFSVNKY